MKLGAKLLLTLLVVGIVPLFLMGVFSIHEVHSVLAAQESVDPATTQILIARLRWILGAVGVLTVAGIALIAYFVIRSVTRPLRFVVDRLTQGARYVEQASIQVAQSSQQLANSSNQQAANIEETSASLVEMSTMTDSNRENTLQANSMAEKARAAAVSCREAMDRMSGAIAKIKTSSDETAKVVKTIDDIAFQTNLLSLNAAVEAARAGEAGRGFAVVADEVRNLALHSAQAAKNTADLIQESQNNSAAGVNASGQVVEVLEDILTTIMSMTELISQISSASQEQAEGIKQINEAVSQMESVTQANTGSAERSAIASERLSNQAKELNDVVGVLAALVHGRDKREEKKRQIPHTSRPEIEESNQSAQTGPDDFTEFDMTESESYEKDVKPEQPRALPQRKVTRGGTHEEPKKKHVRPEHIIPLDEEEENRYNESMRKGV